KRLPYPVEPCAGVLSSRFFRICARSSSPSQPASLGSGMVAIQTSAQMMPLMRVTRKDALQPQIVTSQPTNSAPKPTPKDCPSEIEEIASPYSERGAQARTVLVPTGQAAASP